MSSWPPNEGSALGRTLQRINDAEPKYGAKLSTEMARADAAFFERAERFLTRFETFLGHQGKVLDDGIDYHLKLRGEMIVHQHTDAPPGLNLVFQRREVTCGFTGTYSDGLADIDGTALVGSYSIPFRARLTLKSRTADI